MRSPPARRPRAGGTKSRLGNSCELGGVDSDRMVLDPEESPRSEELNEPDDQLTQPNERPRLIAVGRALWAVRQISSVARMAIGVRERNRQRDLRDDVGVVHDPVTRRFHPQVEIRVADARRTECVAGRELIRAERRRRDLRQGAAERMSRDVDRLSMPLARRGLRKARSQPETHRRRAC